MLWDSGALHPPGPVLGLLPRPSRSNSRLLRPSPAPPVALPSPLPTATLSPAPLPRPLPRPLSGSALADARALWEPTASDTTR